MKRIKSLIGATAPYWGAMAVFVGAVAFSGKAILVKVAYQNHTDYITLLALRMGFSLPFFVVIALITKKEASTNPNSKDYFWLFFLGLIGYYLSSIFDFAGLSYVTASLERLILFIYPTIVVILSAIFLKKKINKIIQLALVLTYAGIALVFLKDDTQQQINIFKGSTLIFMSAFTYAMYLMGTGNLIPKFGATLYTCYVMSIASLAVLIHYFVEYPVSPYEIPKETYQLGLVMAVFCTVLPSFLISYGIKIIGASRAAIIASVGPISTTIMAYFFLHENISIIQIVGTVLVMAGVLIVSLQKK